MNIFRDIKDLPDFRNAVITIGSFDGVHTGHMKILHRVRNLATEIGGESVVITFYPHPRMVIDTGDSNLSLLNTLDEKLSLISQAGIMNVVVVPFSFEFSQLSPREYIENFIVKLFKPRYVVIGYDHKFGLNRGGDLSLFKEYEKTGHFRVIEIPKHEVDDIAVSSTKIRKALLTGQIEEANMFLNYPYFLTGKVVHGDKMGTKLGYPTANLQLAEKQKLIPQEGVYAVKIGMEGSTFEGMMYIGKRPTVSNQTQTNIEINIFEFSQDIYDKFLNIQILRFLRKDIKFENLNELKEQLRIDEKNALMALEEVQQDEVQKPRVTIAILNYNGVDMLEAYLPRIMYSSEKYGFDVLVIDNNSEDLSAEFLQEWYPEIKICQLSKNYGYADGYNKGLVDVETDYVAILNSDIQVTENWLDPIIEAMDADKNIGVVQPVILSLENKSFFEYAGAAGGHLDYLGYPFCRGRIFQSVEKNEGQYDTDADIFWASGATMVTRTRLFKSLGGFDYGFFAHQEEIDYCWRASNAGYAIKCIAKSKVYHLGGGTLDYNNPRKDFLNFRNNLYLLTKNENITKLLWLIPAKLVLDGIAGLKFLLEGKPKSTLSVIRAHMSYYIHLPLVFERKNKEHLWIVKSHIGRPNIKGRYMGSIVWKYFIEGVKKFSDLRI